MRKLFFKLLLVVLSLTSVTLSAQDKTKPQLDTLTLTVLKLSKSVQALEKIKLSGYIQSQFQVVDTAGAKSFNGGDFATASAMRFQVRRAYLKMAYFGKLSTYVLQINVNEKGFTLRDAYFSLKDPWIQALSLTGGIFFRPFGYELSYSTNLRESPELGRVTQVLFPNERDLGASLCFQLPEKSPLHFLKVEAGVFSGNAAAAETDNKLDFIGRVGISDDINNKKISFGAGLSYYDGYIYQAKKEVYQMFEFEGIRSFCQRTADTIPGKYYSRRYFGIDAQFSIRTILGTTTLKGDFVKGDQPGSDKSSVSPSAAIDYPLYLRKFKGEVLYLSHTIPNTIHSLVLKFDYYDPNTDVSGNDIGKKEIPSKASNAADVAYTTWGFGYFADVNRNLRLTLYYELITNETSSSLTGFGRDLKDNLLTARVQYKF